ncbi:MAG: enolase C-terminal domain-like protein, partial [Bryobacteraceae bacterium]
AGRPVAQLLGGYRDKLRVYRTTVWPWTASHAPKGPPMESDESDIPYETQAKFAVRLKEAGFHGIKVRAWRPHPMDDVDMVGMMRAAAGPDFKIMLDRTAVRPGWVWDYPTALQVCRGLEKHKAYWLEEPFDGHDIYGPARLAAEVDILISGGELAKSTFEFLEFLVNKTYDILQPDTRICGGILMANKISILADTFGVPCIQHGAASLSLAGYLQSGCAMRNCEWQEIIGGPNLPQEQWEPAKKLVRTPDVFRIEDGYIYLPDLPGLGLDLNEDAIAEYRVHA